MKGTTMLKRATIVCTLVICVVLVGLLAINARQANRAGHPREVGVAKTFGL
jgi:hypothetical protein